MTKLYNTPQAATYLKRHYSTLKLAISKGRLVGKKLNYNTRVFTKEELDTFDKEWPKGARSKKNV